MSAEWFAILVLTGFSFGLGWAVVSLWIEVKAMKNSTHSVQFVNPLAKFEEVTEEVKNTLHRDPFEPIM